MQGSDIGDSAAIASATAFLPQTKAPSDAFFSGSPADDSMAQEHTYFAGWARSSLGGTGYYGGTLSKHSAKAHRVPSASDHHSITVHPPVAVPGLLLRDDGQAQVTML